MSLRVLFFGSTAALAGCRQVEIDFVDETTAKAVFDKIFTDFPHLAAHRLLYSINQNYATGDEIVRDGDELAIFTAVSGG